MMDKIWIPFGRFKPGKNDEMYYYKGKPRKFTKRKGIYGWFGVK